MKTFSDLGLALPVLKALDCEGYDKPTPIQTQAIPPAINGCDILGIAQTGTGKTAAFALPIIHRLVTNRKALVRKRTRVLVLSPTRELATQIAASFDAYARNQQLSITTVFGGVGYGPQIKTLARGVDVLVATPGRLLDHLANGAVKLDQTETLVLDEADQMLDLGFVKPIRSIVSRLPRDRQTLFFSATMPSSVTDLSRDFLRDPKRVSVTPVYLTADRVKQRVIHLDVADKRQAVAKLIVDQRMERTLVFTRTKRGADKVAKHLDGFGISTAAIHGNKSQNQRERALDAFRNAKIQVLVATDIAARGIDIEGVSHVINFELPEVPEAYVHRIGRTARAGASGSATPPCDPP
ncbi:MAG: DEAD/DEAH box helicase [Hyphomicrobiaceae bacterium]